MTKKKAMGKDPFANRLSWIKDTQQNLTTNDESLDTNTEKDVISSTLETKTPSIENSSISLSSNDINTLTNPILTNNKLEIDQEENLEQARNKTTAHKGLKDGWTRATLIIREDHLDMLKAVAYLERIDIKDLVESICNNYIQVNSEQVKEALALYFRKKK